MVIRSLLPKSMETMHDFKEPAFLIALRIMFFFFFWWGLLHGPQQGPDRVKEKPIRLGKGKLLPKQKNPP